MKQDEAGAARVASPDAQSSRLDTALSWLLIALTPVLLGLLTWDPESTRDPVQDWIRVTGFPVVGVELIVILVAMRRGFEPLGAIRSAPVLVQAALLVLTLIAFANAAVVAPDGAGAALRSGMALVHLLFALSVAHLVSATEEWRGDGLWIWIVGGIGAFLVLLALFVAMIPAPDRFDWMHLGLGVMNIRHVGFFSAVGTAAALGLASGATGTRNYLASIAAASVMFGMSFWGGSRGPLSGVLAGFALGLILVPAFRSRRAVIAVLISLPAGALLSLIHSVPNAHYGIARLTVAASQTSLAEVSSGRMDLWAGTWKAILNRPLFGFGEDQLTIVVPESLGIFHHPHNSVLQILFQWGFVGAICFAGLALFVAWHCHKRLRVESHLLLCPFLVVATLLIMSLHDGTLFFGYPLMMVALCLGVLAGARPALGTANKSIGGTSPRTEAFTSQ